MKIALVDYENCRKIEKVFTQENVDEVVVFTSNQAQLKPSTDRTYECTVINCINGEKDAMDIQLSYYLGLNCTKDNEYIIYSGDKGYDSMVKFACNKGFKIKRKNINDKTEKDIVTELRDIGADIINQTNVPKKVKWPNIYHLSRIVTVITNKDTTKVYAVLSSCRKDLPKDKDKAKKLFTKHFGVDGSKFLMKNFDLVSYLLGG